MALKNELRIGNTVSVDGLFITVEINRRVVD